MQVKITGTATVCPSSPPFQRDHVLSLSHLDNDRNLNVTFRYLRAYDSSNRRDSAADPFHAITTALSAALVHYYPFVGTLRGRESDGRLQLHCAVGGGVPVVRAAVDCSLDSVNYLDDPADLWIEKLVPDPGPDEALADPLILQITTFRCGGFSLGAAVHHSLGDGLGVTQFFNAMAAFARGATQLSVDPIWDRANLLRPREPPRVEFPVHEFLTVGKALSSGSDEPVCRECFPVKEVWLDRLKLSLQQGSGVSFTTFEALGAFIWRAKVKASGIDDDEKVKFVYAMNMRKIVKPPLPAGYWGNGCAPMYVQLSAGDLVERPLWETALLIKKSKHNATDEYVRSFIDFQELNYENGISGGGGGVSGFTDWRHLGHSTVDFGWGGPVTVLPLSRNILGSSEPCFFLPYSLAKGGDQNGFQVLVHAKEAALAGFRAEMEKLSQL